MENQSSIKMKRVNWLVISREKGDNNGKVIASCTIKPTAQKLIDHLINDGFQGELVLQHAPLDPSPQDL